MPLIRFSILLAIVILSRVAVFAQLSNGADSLLNKLKNYPQDDSLRVNLLNQLAYEFYLSSPEQSLDYAYEAIALSKQLNYPRGEAQGLRQVGLVAWAQSNYSSALKNFVNGLKIAERLNDEQTMADITGNIGLVYHGLENYSEALMYHERSLKMQRKLRNEVRESVALNNIGDVSRSLKKYDDAVEYYTLAIKLREKDGNLNGVATNLRNIGNVMEARGLFFQALDYYFRSLHISDSLPDKRGMSQCRQSIASVYFKMKKYQEAQEYAKAGLEVAKQAKYRAFIRDAYLLLSQITEARGNNTEAFNFFKLYSQYKDSVVNLQVGSEIASYRLDYETEKKQVEIDLLKKEALLQESIISKKNALLTLAIVTFLLLAFLTFVIFRNYGRQKKVNRILETKNKEIEDQHNEISQQRDELMALNEEIRAQQEDVIASRDALEEKNKAIAEMNERILTINENLEKIIAERTAALEKQNKQLVEYAFINAHKLRAPLARVMGLTSLIHYTPQSSEQIKLITLLQQATQELDDITRSITQVVQEGLDAYQHKS
jgi:tetratricopeptide (TPR) repeat protein